MRMIYYWFMTKIDLEIVFWVILLGAMILGGAFFQNQESQTCKERGGILIQSEYGSTCVKKDSVINIQK